MRWENQILTLEFTGMHIMLFSCWFKESSDIQSSFVQNDGASIFLGSTSAISPVSFSVSRFQLQFSSR
jgi:hypothetical protein